MFSFVVGGREARKTNVIYKYLLGSLILTFPICSEDSIHGIYFLGYILKALAGFPIYLFLVLMSANICYTFVQKLTTTKHIHTRMTIQVVSNPHFSGSIFAIRKQINSVGLKITDH